MFPSPDEETELDVEDVIKAATKVLDAVRMKSVERLPLQGQLSLQSCYTVVRHL